MSWLEAQPTPKPCASAESLFSCSPPCRRQLQLLRLSCPSLRAAAKRQPRKGDLQLIESCLGLLS